MFFQQKKKVPGLFPKLLASNYTIRFRFLICAQFSAIIGKQVLMEKFDTYVDENGIVNMLIKGRVRKEVWDQFKKWIEDTEKIIKEQNEKTGKKVRAIVDLTDASSQYDSDTIAALASFTKANEPYIEKTATFGANTMIKFAEDLVITISGRKNIRAFGTKEEANKWLLSK